MASLFGITGFSFFIFDLCFFFIYKLNEAGCTAEASRPDSNRFDIVDFGLCFRGKSSILE